MWKTIQLHRELGSCAATIYFTSRLYSRICGRVIGCQIGSPDGFNFHDNSETNSEIRLDGISITYGTRHHHIWSYVAGISEMENVLSNRCPCTGEQAMLILPQFIGDNYYCESGNHTDSYDDNHFFLNDKLWDGQQCEGTCCSGTNSSTRMQAHSNKLKYQVYVLDIIISTFTFFTYRMTACSCTAASFNYAGVMHSLVLFMQRNNEKRDKQI